ncbi:hypothetical protein ABMA28_001422 [Loxostege sticticalis]|uniref:FLYWCH-type domain-containing protein n=1 Tax=Loxostege sticticalis TaxID=481309 RepID=A0ABD0T1M2_LOXSC
MINGYTFSKMSGTKNYICSSKLSCQCEAKIRMETPDTRGGRLVMIDGHTFSKKFESNMWICSKKLARHCTAKIKMNDGVIVQYNLEHNHPPDKYHRCNDGKYVKI